MGNCGTCHWILRDGRCSNHDSPHGLNRDQMSASDSCSYYMMNPILRRSIEAQQEEQERQERERQERERKERERQEWLKTAEGQKWLADEKERKHKELEEHERKERIHQEWLKTEEGQRLQKELDEKETNLRMSKTSIENKSKSKRVSEAIFHILFIIYLVIISLAFFGQLFSRGFRNLEMLLLSFIILSPLALPHVICLVTKKSTLKKREEILKKATISYDEVKNAYMESEDNFVKNKY